MAIRFASKEDRFMEVSDASRMEMEHFWVYDNESTKYLYALIVSSDVALAYEDHGKVKALMGFGKLGDFWLVMGKVKYLPFSFYKDMRSLCSIALSRYGRVATLIMADEEAGPKFKRLIARYVGGTLYPVYEEAGHKWQRMEAKPHVNL